MHIHKMFFWSFSCMFLAFSNLSGFLWHHAFFKLWIWLEWDQDVQDEMPFLHCSTASLQELYSHLVVTASIRPLGHSYVWWKTIFYNITIKCKIEKLHSVGWRMIENIINSLENLSDWRFMKLRWSCIEYFTCHFSSRPPETNQQFINNLKTMTNSLK